MKALALFVLLGFLCTLTLSGILAIDSTQEETPLFSLSKMSEDTLRIRWGEHTLMLNLHTFDDALSPLASLAEASKFPLPTFVQKLAAQWCDALSAFWIKLQSI